MRKTAVIFFNPKVLRFLIYFVFLCVARFARERERERETVQKTTERERRKTRERKVVLISVRTG